MSSTVSTGNHIPGWASSTAPSGASASRRPSAVTGVSPARAWSAETISGRRTTERPSASATARTVTSSWVGPMPPLVKT